MIDMEIVNAYNSQVIRASYLEGHKAHMDNVTHNNENGHWSEHHTEAYHDVEE